VSLRTITRLKVDDRADIDLERCGQLAHRSCCTDSSSGNTTHPDAGIRRTHL
jgi:hypothetical protein